MLRTGHPGIGKTRLVLQALEVAHAQRHVLVASSHSAGIKALSEDALAHFAQIVLVIDDVPRDSVEYVVALFRQEISGRA